MEPVGAPETVALRIAVREHRRTLAEVVHHLA
jgi:hypothetical protein